jgi:hypothetical protein
MERANRTLREELDGEVLATPDQARGVLARVIRRYNEARLHSALGYLRPMDYYRGDPTALHKERRKKLADARHRRETNLAFRLSPRGETDGARLPAVAENPVLGRYAVTPTFTAPPELSNQSPPRCSRIHRDWSSRVSARPGSRLLVG